MLKFHEIFWFRQRWDEKRFRVSVIGKHVLSHTIWPTENANTMWAFDSGYGWCDHRATVLLVSVETLIVSKCFQTIHAMNWIWKIKIKHITLVSNTAWGFEMKRKIDYRKKKTPIVHQNKLGGAVTNRMWFHWRPLSRYNSPPAHHSWDHLI